MGNRAGWWVTGVLAWAIAGCGDNAPRPARLDADAALPDAAVEVDAATPDSAIPDAAIEIDAAVVEVDAAAPDAALAADAATPDASTGLDGAALPDAAQPDAAIPDAAIPDAAFPDAGSPDASRTLVAATPTTVQVIESSSTGANFSIVLLERPASAVTLTVSANQADVVTLRGPGQPAGAAATLTFQPDTFATPQMVTVVAIEDFDQADEWAILTIRGHGTSVDVAARVYDRTGTDFTLLGAPFEPLEGFGSPLNPLLEGTVLTTTVNLQYEPGPVSYVLVRSSDPGVILVDGLAQRVLTFTRANWSTPQTVVLSAVHDADTLDPAVVRARYAICEDACMSGIVVAFRSVAIQVEDDD